MMTNGDPEGRIFLSYPHMNNGFFFLLTPIFIYLYKNKLPEVPDYAKMQFHMMTLLDVLDKIAWVRLDFYPMVKSQIYLYGGQETYLSHGKRISEISSPKLIEPGLEIFILLILPCFCFI